MEEIAQKVRIAMETRDLASYCELLDPDVRWGAPDAKSPTCKNRQQVLAWYEQGLSRGTRAQVTEIIAIGSHLLVGMLVSGNTTADPGEQTERWQVLTIRNGRVVDIVGFEDRSSASNRIDAQSIDAH
jgi:ketosteroid isomerase-like protein